MSRKKFRLPTPPRLTEKVRFWLEYAAVRLVSTLVAGLPLRVAVGVCRFAAAVVYHLDSGHRKVAENNLRVAFPKVPEREIQKLAKETFRHFGTGLAEVFFLSRRLTSKTWRKFVRFRGLDLLESALDRGQGVLLLAAHLGNWELAGHLVPLLGYPLTSVAFRIKNAPVSRLMENVRRRSGQQIVYANQNPLKLLSALRQGRIVAVLVDQNARKDGLETSFFGRPASTHWAIGWVSLRYSVPILPIYVARVGKPFCYEIGFGPLLEPGTEVADLPQLVQAYTGCIEEQIRRFPAQWIWFHRRWKKPGRKAHEILERLTRTTSPAKESASTDGKSAAPIQENLEPLAEMENVR